MGNDLIVFQNKHHILVSVNYLFITKVLAGSSSATRGKKLSRD